MVNDRLEPGLHVASVAAILRRRRRAILAATLVGGLLGLGLGLVLPRVYRARVRIEIRRAPDQHLPWSESFQSEQVSMFTAAEMLTSRALLGRIVEEDRGRGWVRGGPDGLTDRFVSWFARVFAAVGARLGIDSPEAAPPRPSSGDRLSDEIDWLQSIVTVEPVRDTRLVDIRVEHTDPAAARGIAGRIGELAEQSVAPPAAGDSSRVPTATAAATGDAPWTAGGLMVDRAAVQARSRRLSAGLSDLTRRRLEIDSERLDAVQQLAGLRRAAGDTSLADPGALTDAGGALGELRRSLLDCRQRLAAARGVYGPQHPRLLALQQECAAVRAEAQRALARSIAELGSRINLLESRERALDAQLAGTEGDLRQALELEPAEVAAPAPVVMPAVARARAIEVVDGPMVDPRPVRPRIPLDVAVCAAVGGLLASAFSLWTLGDPRTLRSPEEVEAELGLPVLGVLPRRPGLALTGGAR